MTITIPANGAPSAERDARTSLRARLGTLSRQIASSMEVPASRAALTRGGATDVVRTAVFHRLMSTEADASIAESRLLSWAAVAQCMAIAGDPEAALTDGAALATADFSESRFSRLLAVKGEKQLDQFLLAARFLHSRTQPCHWLDLGELLLVDSFDPDRADRLRLRLARDYYRIAAR